MAGNAVTPNAARDIIAACVESLGYEVDRDPWEWPTTGTNYGPVAREDVFHGRWSEFEPKPGAAA